MVQLTLLEWVTKVPVQKLNSGGREVPINHIQKLTPRKKRKTAMLKARKKFNIQYDHIKWQNNNLYLCLGTTSINIELHRSKPEAGLCISTSLFTLWSGWTFLFSSSLKGLWGSLLEGTSQIPSWSDCSCILEQAVLPSWGSCSHYGAVVLITGQLFPLMGWLFLLRKSSFIRKWPAYKLPCS